MNPTEGITFKAFRNTTILWTFKNKVLSTCINMLKKIASGQIPAIIHVFGSIISLEIPREWTFPAASFEFTP